MSAWEIVAWCIVLALELLFLAIVLSVLFQSLGWLAESRSISKKEPHDES